MKQLICKQTFHVSHQFIFHSKKYFKLRSAIYQVHRKINDKLGLVPYQEGIELHGNNFLSGALFENIDDDFRHEILSDIVGIVNRFKIQIYRIGYDNAKEIAAGFKDNEKLYGLHILNFSLLLNILTRKHRVMAIMDLVDKTIVKKLSRTIFIQTSNAEMFRDRQHSFAIAKPQNIVECVAYVDSKFSEISQIADIVWTSI